MSIKNDTNLIHFLIVVSQAYDARVIDEYILSGNSAVLKCLVPSFVADFLEVISWELSDGQSFTASGSEENFGKFWIVVDFLFTFCLIAFMFSQWPNISPLVSSAIWNKKQNH